MTTNFFYSPLEQFEILPLIPLYLGGIDFSITNETIILIVIFFTVQTFFLFCTNEKAACTHTIQMKNQTTTSNV